MGEHIRYIQSALINCYVKSDSFWDQKFQLLVLTIIEYTLIDNRNYNGQNQTYHVQAPVNPSTFAY